MRHLKFMDRTLCGKEWKIEYYKGTFCFSCYHSLRLHATDRGGKPQRFQSITRWKGLAK